MSQSRIAPGEEYQDGFARQVKGGMRATGTDTLGRGSEYGRTRG